MKTPVLMLGAGGHAKVLLDCLRTVKDIIVLGIVDNNPDLKGKKILNISVLGCESDIMTHYPPNRVQLINGIGSIELPTKREKIFNQFKNIGYAFLTVIHPTAYIGHEVLIKEGAQLMAGSTIQPGTVIGHNVIINTHAAIDHDGYIEDHVHIAPGALCCGDVYIGKGTHVGCGAVVRQGIKIAERCVIAAGSVVIRDIVYSTRVAGVPAKAL